MASAHSNVPRRLLFVCAGNTCRSPMAAAIAANDLPNTAVESAGLYPGPSVAANAVTVVAEMVGADISDHLPRDLNEVDIAGFDLIVALDLMVGKELAGRFSPETVLLVWNVPDPYGQPLDCYRRCAEMLRARIGELANAR